uniref:Uncharacterized protein n=1 Tax=Phlebotomus papatasi TaxID=29031 RepID=A0A1B0EXZ7_PHLPP
MASCATVKAHAKYFMGILTVLREASNDESKELLATNVIEQTKGREIVLSSHQIASKVIENLLEFCSDETLGEYQEAFKADIRSLCLNGFSSHVLEKLISISAMRYLTKNSVEDEPPEKKIKTEDGIPPGNLSQSKSFVETCSKFLLNNLEEFVWDSYANHVIRTCLTTLSGRILEEKVPIPGEWTEMFKEYVARLRDWPFFADFPYQELTSGLLQFLIQALARVDKNTLKSIGGFFTEPNTSETPEEDQESPSKLHKLFSTESSIRFLEVLISVAGNKLFTKIFLRLFQGNFKELSLLKSANFSVQKLLDNMKNKDEFNICFTELEPHFAEILQTGHTGIILALCLACKRLEINQNQFIKHGQFSSLNEILELDDFGVKVLEKFCQSIVQDSSEAGGGREAAAVQKTSQILTPKLTEEKRNKVRSLCSVQVGIDSVSWCRMELQDEEDPSIVTHWQYFSLNSKKSHLSDLTQMIMHVNQLIPDTDAFVLETPITRQASPAVNATQIAVNVRQSQIIAMMTLILSLRSQDFNPCVFFLKTYLAARLFGTLVGKERTSSLNTVSQILASGTSNEAPDKKSEIAPKGKIITDPDVLAKYQAADGVQKEYMGRCLMLGVCCLRLSLLKCPTSLSIVNRKSK